MCLGSGAGLGGKCKYCFGRGRTFGGKAREVCEPCDGSGKVNGVACKPCEGHGWILANAKPRRACGFCMASGKTVGGSCKHCGGTGYMDLDPQGNVIDLAIAASKEQKCPFCLGMGYRARGARCDSCAGTGIRKVDPNAPVSVGAPTAAAGLSAPAPVDPSTLTGPAADLARLQVMRAKQAQQAKAAEPVANPNALKLGASKFCMGCGSGIPAGAPTCPKCGKAAPA